MPVNSVELSDYQIDVIRKMKNGCILVGGVGTGKSRTSLEYYMLSCGGKVPVNGIGKYEPMDKPRDLYIITTAQKRDKGEWLTECLPFHLSTDPNLSLSNVKVTVDSWNNIKKYQKVYGAFFIFDEQRVVGSGAWAKAFLNIARKNQWILLSATPGDTWSDYMAVFIANGFYKNKTEFTTKHVIYNPYVKYRQIDRYVSTGELIRHRNDILVVMKRDTGKQKMHKYVPVDYDKFLYKRILKDRWDIYEDEPIQETGKLCYLMRRVVNSDPSREIETLNIIQQRKRVIIFYNYDYELDILRNLLDENEIPYAEWNGQKHEPLPDGSEWAYLVQYAAGAEGWNCITSDTIIFFSQNYSYKMTAQAQGRIDRMNSPYDTLYYYHLRSTASIDLAIQKALKNKKKFNESSFVKKFDSDSFNGLKNVA